MTLEFSFEVIEQEFENFVKIADDFLDPSATPVIRSCIESLRGIRTAEDGKVCPWSISKIWPIKTHVCSLAQNARDPYLRGSLSMAWHIKIPLGTPRDQGRRARAFVLAGKTSTTISLSHEPPGVTPTECARWSFEIGNADSPGCHIHVQVKAGETNAKFFPETLSVPRLPGILVTPIDSLDFLLGEVFQEEWSKRLGVEKPELQAWANIQRDRMSRIFAWQLEHIRKNRGPSWNLLKRAKPRTDLLLT